MVKSYFPSQSKTVTREMEHADLTFVFENDRAYAVREGKVVESAETVEELETKLAGGHAPDCSCGFCANKGSFGKKDDDDDDSEPAEDESEEKVEKESATHIVTPNGLRGQILGKVKGTWSDEVTVRFENGNIMHIPVSDDITFTSSTSKTASSSPLVSLNTRIAATVDGTTSALTARDKELDRIEHEAREIMAQGVSWADEQELDTIIVQAANEKREIFAALEHLADAEPFAPPAPLEPQVVQHQHAVGPHSGWLDNTIDQMITEAESTDYDKLMDEGPEVFVSQLPDAPLADQGVTHQMASSYIRGRTAGASDDVRENYERIWLDRVEQVRRAELAGRKQAARKQASAEQEVEDTSTDEGLFL